MSHVPGEPERTFRRYACGTCGAPAGQACQLSSRSHVDRRNQAVLDGTWNGVVRLAPMPRDVLLGELDALLGTEPPHRLAARLGRKPRSIERALDRAGRHADARLFGRVWIF